MIDSHCHLDDPALDATRDEVVARAHEAGVRSWVIAGTRPATWDRTTRVAEETGGVALLGVHPWYVDEVADTLDEALERLRQLEPVGFGEMGLDAVRGPSPAQRALQRKVLRAQLALARQLDRPVAFHCVRAAPELLTLLERDGLPKSGGMMHGWSGPPDQAERAVKLGLMVSFGPLVCRERARRVREAAVRVPLEHLLVETDAPDQPLDHRTHGEPADVVTVLTTLASLRNQDVERIAFATAANARRLWWSDATV